MTVRKKMGEWEFVLESKTIFVFHRDALSDATTNYATEEQAKRFWEKVEQAREVLEHKNPLGEVGKSEVSS